MISNLHFAMTPDQAEECKLSRMNVNPRQVTHRACDASPRKFQTLKWMSPQASIPMHGALCTKLIGAWHALQFWHDRLQKCWNRRRCSLEAPAREGREVAAVLIALYRQSRCHCLQALVHLHEVQGPQVSTWIHMLLTVD